MKRKFNIVLVLALVVSLFAGCASAVSKSAPVNPVGKGERPKIVATIFPVYDWVKNVVGDKADVTLLLDSGVDLHNYQPTAQDILTISNADMFVYVGGESDEWVDGVLATASNKNLKSVNLLEVLSDSIKEEEVVEGMQGEEEHEDEEAEEEPEYDEHVWLSVKNAINVVEFLNKELDTISPVNKEEFDKNTVAYVEKLRALDKEFASLNKNTDTILFADRFPFRYFADDYNLNYFAAFVGCSAETEASFETISFLANKVDELNLKYIYKIEGRNDNIAQTVVKTSNSNPEVLEVNSMQSVNAKDVKDGASYLSIMEKNLEVFKKGLNNE